MTSTLLAHLRHSIRRIQGRHEELTDGLPTSEAPESYLQVKFAEALRGRCHSVTLEVQVAALLKHAGTAQGRVPRGSPTGRVDVVGWNKRGKPIVVAEIKSTGNTSACRADARRIRQLMGRSGTTLEVGLIIYCTGADSAEEVRRRFKKVGELRGFSLHRRARVHGSKHGRHAYSGIAMFVHEADGDH